MEGFCYVKAKGGGHSGLLMVKLDMVVQFEFGKPPFMYSLRIISMHIFDCENYAHSYY